MSAGLKAAWCGVASTGAVWIYSGECSCAYPDCGGYSAHEPHCGMDLVGYLPRAAAVMPDADPWYGAEPDLIPAMLWDFGGYL